MSIFNYGGLNVGNLNTAAMSITSSMGSNGRVLLSSNEKQSPGSKDALDSVTIVHYHSSQPKNLPILQLAWAVVLSIYTGSDDIIFDELSSFSLVPVAGCHEFTASVRLQLNMKDPVTLAFQALQITNPKMTQDGNRILLAIRQAGYSNFDNYSVQQMDIYGCYSLVVECHTIDTHTSMKAIFQKSIWPAETVSMMLYQFRHALGLMSNSLGVKVNDLRSICPEGLDLLRKFQPSPPPEKELATIWPLIQRNCKSRPLSPAINSWDGNLTYGELEQRVNVVSWELSQAGLKPNTFAGLLLEKSAMATVVILGVIRAGGAFVLLDSTQPTKRLRTICTISKVMVVVTSPSNISKAASLGLPILSTANFPLATNKDVAIEVQPQDALYAGFTSGSTGDPKGFVIDHASFVSGLDDYCRGMNLSHSSRVFLFASFSFVVCITGQLAPLTQGACLCVPSQTQLENNLAGAIVDLTANWVSLTPSAARILDPDSVPTLTTLVMVGEGLSQSDLAKWQGRTLFSLYGQSENSKGTMISRKSSMCPLNSSNIGMPYCGVAWIVDPKDHTRLSAAGEEGELLLEGPCLTQGYLGNSEQPDMSFVSNPPWLQLVRRNAIGHFFKTGDIARQNLTDGSFQLLGRKGTRVKIRGQRVELAEVEYQTRQLLPEAKAIVAEIVCPSDEVDQLSPMLVALVVSQSELAVNGMNESPHILSRPTTDFRNQMRMVRSKLREILPEYMVPATFVKLSSLPMTTTGKVHRRHLRDSVSALSRKELMEYTVLRAAHQEPASETAAKIRELCGTVLHISPDDIGMDDSFLDLGGDSLTARHFISLSREQGIVLLLEDLLQQNSLASLVSSEPAASHKGQPPMYQELHTDTFNKIRVEFLKNLPSSISRDNLEEVLPTLELQAAYASNHDCFPLHVTGRLDEKRLHRACKSLVNRHTILRTVFHFFRGDLIQVVMRQLNVSFAVQRCGSAEEVDKWTTSFGDADVRKRYSIDKPIIGFILVTSSQDRKHVLIMRLSHGQYDALSLRPLIHDLWEAYKKDTQLESLHIDAVFRTHVHRCLQLRTPHAYTLWTQILHGALPPTLPWTPPVDDSEATLVVYHRELSKANPIQGITQATMIKAAWLLALQQQTARDDIVFGQFVHAWTGVQGVIGPCMNVVPVRVRPGSGWTRRQLAHAIQSQHAQTTPFHTTGWQDIVSKCTDWPVDTHLTSVVLHQNFDRNIEVRIDEDLACRKALPFFSPWPVFPVLLVTHPGRDKLDVLLLISSKFGGKEQADRMLGYFSIALSALEEEPDKEL